MRLYLELMLVFGSHFVTDPQYAWAGEILSDREPAQMLRAEKIYDKARDYRAKVVGPGDEYALRALRNVSALANGALPLTTSNFKEGMLQELSRVYPEKADYIGRDAMNAVIDKGDQVARDFGFSTVRSVALPIVLMFAFGHGCFEDLLYPWIGKTIKDESISDPETKSKRLEKKALTWLDHVLENFEGQKQ
jgi:hypothetical protein